MTQQGVIEQAKTIANDNGTVLTDAQAAEIIGNIEQQMRRNSNNPIAAVNEAPVGAAEPAPVTADTTVSVPTVAPAPTAATAVSTGTPVPTVSAGEPAPMQATVMVAPDPMMVHLGRNAGVDTASRTSDKLDVFLTSLCWGAGIALTATAAALIVHAVTSANKE